MANSSRVLAVVLGNLLSDDQSLLRVLIDRDDVGKYVGWSKSLLETLKQHLGEETMMWLLPLLVSERVRLTTLITEQLQSLQSLPQATKTYVEEKFQLTKAEEKYLDEEYFRSGIEAYMPDLDTDTHSH